MPTPPASGGAGAGTGGDGTITFLFTDIEGSTRLLKEAGADYGDLLDAHRRLLRAAFTAHHGREVDTQGDAFFVAFTSPSDAVAASVAAQRALAAHDWPPGRQVRVRMGLHTGEATAVGEGYVGLDVHRGARIGAVAHGEQVLVSETTAALVRGRLPAGTELRDLGEHRLKDLDRPERLYQLQVPGLATDFPAPTSRSPLRLPGRLSRFIGRDAELSALAALLDDDVVRLVTLAGPGGIGKTRLALEVADRVQARFEDGVAVVLLAPVRDPALVALAIRQVLGVSDTSGGEHLEVVAEYLRDRHLLLVLDNFEHVIDAAPVVAELLRRTDRLKVLATTREVLRISGEHEFDVPPLPLPVGAEVDDVRASEAVRLFLDRAEAAQRGFKMTAENAAAIAEIARRLDGLPLALELAAARVRLMPPEMILRKLASRLDLLTGGPRDAPERHQTLRGTIAWSYDLLDDPDRRLLECLAVFSGGFALDAAEAVCAGEGVDDVMGGLASLTEKSLLRPQAGLGGEARFTMLETLREFALERLREHDDVEATRRRHADFFADLAERARPSLQTGDQDTWLDRLRVETDNIRVAMAWFGDRRQPGPVARAGWAMWPFWWEEGHMLEGAGWMEGALRDGDLLTDDDRAKATTVLGILCFGWGDYERAVPTLRLAAELCRQTGNAFGLGMALAMGGVITAVRGMPAEGAVALAQSLDAFREADDAWGVAFADYTLGRVLLLQGQNAEALSTLERAVAGAREVEEKTLLGLALLNLGWARLGTGDVPGATGDLRESLVLINRLHNRIDAARALEGMAAAAAAAGRPEQAAQLFGAAEGVRRAVGARVWIPDLPTHQRTEQSLLAALDRPTFEARFHEGTRFSVDDALDLAATL